MNERSSIYERCIVIQLQKESGTQPLTGTPSAQKDPKYTKEKHVQQQQPSQRNCLNFQYRSLCRRRPKHDNCTNSFKDTRRSGLSNSAPTSPTRLVGSPPGSLSNCTPTPTNAFPPVIINNENKETINTISFTGPNCYQNGYHLYQLWVSTNAECVWDPELVKAVKGTHFVGVLVQGFLLIGGPPRVLAAIIHAHSRALLNPPPGWVINVLGDLQECTVSVVHRGQFTPLADALCWAIHQLNKTNRIADQNGIHKSLLMQFPAMTTPEPALIHAALSDLIRQRKVYHTGRGYGIVQEDTYRKNVNLVTKQPKSETLPRLLTTSEALTKAHGVTETVNIGRVTHTAVQTDLADLLSGSWPQKSILTARKEEVPEFPLKRSGSFRGREKTIAELLSERNRGPWQAKYETYTAHDYSDISLKSAEKGSVFSKILSLSNPRRRLSSFSAQFPPPEWNDVSSSVRHFHSVATQTRSSKHPGGPESCTVSIPKWVPKSSTLPRKPSKVLGSSVLADEKHRPHSASPSPAKTSYVKAKALHQQVQLRRHLRQRSSSSTPSPCFASTHSSRPNSPIYDKNSVSQFHYENCYRGREPRTVSSCDKSAPNIKSDSGLSKHRSHSSSPHHIKPILHNSPQRKPLLYQSAIHRNQTPQSLPPKEMPVFDSQISNRDKRSDNNDLMRNSPSRKVRLSHREKDHFKAMKVSSKDGGRVEFKGSTNIRDTIIGNGNVIHSKCESQINGDFKSSKPNRFNLELDLQNRSHMNNHRKIAASPQKPEGLKNNVFHENISSIAKGSVSDLITKNLGYRDINKCEKRLYAEESANSEHQNVDAKLSKLSLKDLSKDSIKEDNEGRTSPILDEKRKLKLSLPLSETSILSEENINNIEKLHKRSLISLCVKTESKCNDVILSPLDQVQSVKTYPSFSDLNLTFSSLAAKKILQGISVNSIDTLVEVNMLAEKKDQHVEDVTNTDFGFL